MDAVEVKELDGGCYNPYYDEGTDGSVSDSYIAWLILVMSWPE